MRAFFFLASLCVLTISCTVERKTEPDCVCDTLRLKSQLSTVSVDSIKIASFYEADSIENQRLWFADIESIDSTQYTRLWDDYHESNFHASHEVFKEHYSESLNTELAFQIGPAGPLWTYYTFVLKKRDCCFVFTRTSFAHARFRYKGYSLLSKQKVDSLFDFVKTLDKTEVDEEAYLMTASFVDNRDEEMFDVAVEKLNSKGHGGLPPDSTVIKFLNFVDTRIKWTETYPLEPEEVQPKLYDNFVISGKYLIESEQGEFEAKVTVEKKETYMYYSWGIKSEKGKLLAAKSSTIDFDQIGKEFEKFEFVKKHVIKEIREYKIRNIKIVTDVIEPR